MTSRTTFRSDPELFSANKKALTHQGFFVVANCVLTERQRHNEAGCDTLLSLAKITVSHKKAQHYMLPAISIGCQQGGPEPCLIPSSKVSLCKALAKHVTSTHCAEIDEYALVLRVDGTLDKFGEEGLARLKLAKTRRYITVDIQIPEKIWQPMSKDTTANYLAKVIQSAIAACTMRLIKEKYSVDVETLTQEVSAGINEYLALMKHS